MNENKEKRIVPPVDSIEAAITFHTALTMEQIEKNFENVDFYAALIEALEHALEHAKKNKKELSSSDTPVEEIGEFLYEEIEKDGKRYLKRLHPAYEPLTTEEFCCYEAGRLESIFRIYLNGDISLRYAATAAVRERAEFMDLLRVWGRRYVESCNDVKKGCDNYTDEDPAEITEYEAGYKNGRLDAILKVYLGNHLQLDDAAKLAGKNRDEFWKIFCDWLSQ